jgi:hypothetical protein
MTATAVAAAAAAVVATVRQQMARRWERDR